LQLNVRQDRYVDFGKANTALLAYGIDLSEAWRASASTSTGFKAPTFNDLYSPWGGNPTLKPERSRNNEVGLHYATPQSQRLDATYFDNRIQDLIASDSSWMMQNLNALRITGWELAYYGNFSGTVLNASITRQNPRDESSGLQLLRRAKDFANVGLGQRTGDFHWGAEWQYSGAREDLNIVTSARTTLPVYRVVNLTALYKLGNQLDLTMRVDNLLKTDYTLAHGYTTPGRSVFIGLNYQ
jgi:vitamin B12 transporter